MLPGIGIFGSDPISKVLIQILMHFEFEIHAIWTNNFDNKFSKLTENDLKYKFPKLITTSIDNVLLNKNVNLIFVCCQPNLHSQISSKALGIGKNVICLFPTCKEIEEIQHMINSARYYPSLVSSISYGGLKYLSEFKLLKQSIPLIGDIKLCNILINCQNLALARNSSYNSFKQDSTSQRHESMSSLIDSIAYLASSTSSSASINWLSDKDLGAGVLNRFGAAMISLILNLFEDKRVNKVFGCLRTFIEDLDPVKSTIRKITADDHCTFQMNLEPGSILVNVSINSLAQSKYTQEVNLCGSNGVLVWNNSKIFIRSLNQHKDIKDLNNNSSRDDNNNYLSGDFEKELILKEPVDKNAEEFFNKYKNFEEKYPELPLIYIRGLYYYLENVKKEFLELNKQNKEQSASSSSSSTNLNQSPNKHLPRNFRLNTIDLENFEHTRIVQTIVKKSAYRRLKIAGLL